MSASHSSSSTATPPSQDSEPNKEIMRDLSRFQRLLLVTDGTVTAILEQYLDEKIGVVKLYQKIESRLDGIDADHRGLLTEDDLPVLARQVVLRGQTTETNWLYAASTILFDRMSPEFRTDLLASREPIGRLWEKHQVETFKRILDYERRPAGALAQHFGIDPRDPVISRTYRVSSGGRLVMIISESFPSGFFLD